MAAISDLPVSISRSLLFARLRSDGELLQAMCDLRAKAEAYANTIEREVGTFTDHSIKHMDALWTVSQSVLTEAEIETLTVAEAFLLACGFYLHDIGMAFAATAAGRKRLAATAEYHASLAADAEEPMSENEKLARAFAASVRSHHAAFALELATSAIPGTSEFLIEPRSVREQFAQLCGEIAASHHWSVDDVDRKLGSRETVPLAGGRSADVGFVAAVLRLVDYAHINRERAPRLARQLRLSIRSDSAVHWNAQQDIDGPLRRSDHLVFHSSQPLTDVDAWWLYYEMIKGLDSEIRQVGAFVQRRQCSKGRLSLAGVHGASSPEACAKNIATDGYLPLEVNVRASSISRLVNLLAGESLYGRNFMAPVRELVQNASDAVRLKKMVAVNQVDIAAAQIPIRVGLTDADGIYSLEIEDWGVGMSRTVLVDHLLTIASDYWESQFHKDFPNATAYAPAGRFGIGFLSVFMIGDSVAVASERRGEMRYKLSVRGLGRRAELREQQSEGASGTKITIQLKPTAVETLKQLHTLIRHYVPMLSVAIVVSVLNTQPLLLSPNWVLDLPVDAFESWVTDTSRELAKARKAPLEDDWSMRFRYSEFIRGSRPMEGQLPDWPLGAPEHREEGLRLVASNLDRSILCLKGLTLQAISTPGFTGVINSDDIAPDASRRQAIEMNVVPFLSRARQSIQSDVIANLNHRASRGFIDDQLDFVARCMSCYGSETLAHSTFPWIFVLSVRGDSRYLAQAELMQLVAESEHLFVGLNTGALGTSAKWARRVTEHDGTKHAFFFPKLRSSNIPYKKEEGEESGSLQSLWEARNAEPFFSLFLSTVADQWQMSIEQLHRQTTWIHKTNELAGYLVRERTS